MSSKHLGKVLLVDDQQQVIYALTRVLTGLGYTTLTASNQQEALALIDQAEVAIFDIRLAEESGLDLLAQVRSLGNELPIIILSAYISPENLVTASRYGAVEILHKPAGVDDIAQALVSAFAKLTPPTTKSSANNQPTAPATEKIPTTTQTSISHQLTSKTTEAVIGISEAMQDTYKTLGLAARNTLSVLLTGETGVGKDISARLIHSQSARAAGPFVAVNTTAIPINLFEAELFGYAAGAFTGAKSSTSGLIESAIGGTLFLDEIGDFPLAAQAKLLRFLEDQSFTRLGDATQRQADVRIIAATNQKLEEKIAAGEFRQDLYFRLALLPIEIPPLRHRKADLAALVDFFIHQANTELGLKILGISDAALAEIKIHRWPGNIRELKNCIFRSAAKQYSGWLNDLEISSKSTHQECNLEELINQALQKNQLAKFLDRVQEQALSQALDFYSGNRSQLAEALGISRNTLRTRLKAFNLDES